MLPVLRGGTLHCICCNCEKRSRADKALSWRRICRFFWINPVAYAQKALVINEFAAPRWQNDFITNPLTGQTLTIGNAVLDQRDLPHAQVWIWAGVAVLSGTTIIFNLLTWCFHAVLERKPSAIWILMLLSQFMNCCEVTKLASGKARYRATCLHITPRLCQGLRYKPIWPLQMRVAKLLIIFDVGKFTPSD